MYKRQALRFFDLPPDAERNSQGQLVGQSFLQFADYGGTQWQAYDEVVRVPATARSFDVVFKGGSTGEAFLDDVAVISYCVDEENAASFVQNLVSQCVGEHEYCYEDILASKQLSRTKRQT